MNEVLTWLLGALLVIFVILITVAIVKLSEF